VICDAYSGRCPSPTPTATTTVPTKLPVTGSPVVMGDLVLTAVVLLLIGVFCIAVARRVKR
jgi:hypothetical protein